VATALVEHHQPDMLVGWWMMGATTLELDLRNILEVAIGEFDDVASGCCCQKQHYQEMLEFH
jgi:hypothetical protein